MAKTNSTAHVTKKIQQNYPRNTVRGRICLGLRLDWDIDQKKETSDIYIKPRCRRWWWWWMVMLFPSGPLCWLWRWVGPYIFVSSLESKSLFKKNLVFRILWIFFAISSHDTNTNTRVRSFVKSFCQANRTHASIGGKSVLNNLINVFTYTWYL